MEQWIFEFVNYLKHMSYAGLVIASSFELIPAEIVLPLAGYWVFEGDFQLIPTILAGNLGSTLGPLILYMFGRYGGRPLLESVQKAPSKLE